MSMKYRRLGNSGLQVSLAGLGTNNFGMRLDYEGSKSVVDAALNAGINFFDHGRHLRRRQVGGIPRQGARIAARGRADCDEVRYACRRRTVHSGRALGITSRRRSSARSSAWAPTISTSTRCISRTPTRRFEETLEALSDLVHRGVVRYIGHSNFTGWQIADDRLDVESERLRPFRLGAERVEPVGAQDRAGNHACLPPVRSGTASLLPLASGFLTGKYTRGAELPGRDTARGLATGDARADRGADLGRQLEQARRADALRRGSRPHHPRSRPELARLGPGGLVVIAGATKPEQIEANVASTLSWELSTEDFAAVDEILG